jgi:hypothetical protein
MAGRTRLFSPSFMPLSGSIHSTYQGCIHDTLFPLCVAALKQKFSLPEFFENFRLSPRSEPSISSVGLKFWDLFREMEYNCSPQIVNTITR